MVNWKTLVLLVIGMLACHLSKASHIVGGEFELVYIDGYSYTLRLNLYFDVEEGSSGARDGFLNAAIYRKSDNQLMGTFRLYHRTTTRVEYFQPECSSGEVVTDKMIYSTSVTLLPEIYNDPEGYYIAWERCCRNYTIDNIFSSDTEVNTVDYAGQTFYLEFPAVIQNGEPFINSSPILFPPLNDYACPNTAYWVNFEGTDPDGDSLVYSMVTPLSTHEAQPLADNQSAGPAPYPEIRWRTDLGYSLDNIMNGAPDLKISPAGRLTVTPTEEGLFVFAVKVDEYRDNIKIGEVRRDFQLLVVDKCTVAEPPVIKGKKLNDAIFTYTENINVSFPLGTADNQRCIEVQVTDPDALKLDDNFTENVWLHAFSLGFKGDVTEVLPEVSRATLVNGSAATFQICFPSCPYLESGSFSIGIVAFDDACTLPYSDTLVVNAYVAPPENNNPYFVDGDDWEVTVEKAVDGFFTREFIALDEDGHNLNLTVLPQGFNPYNIGLTISETTSSPGEVGTLLEWDYDCRYYNFNEPSYSLLMAVTDEGNCITYSSDTLTVTLNIEDPPNTVPDINISLNSDEDDYHYLEHPINSTILFNVRATDEDNDYIEIRGGGLNFGFWEYNIDFVPKTGRGKGGVSSNFSWELPCDFNLDQQNSFNLHFYVQDEHACKISNADAITVEVKTVPPASHPPELNAYAMGNTALASREVISTVGEPVELRLVGADSDKDNLILSMINELPNAEFTSARGNAQVASEFYWQPDCSLFAGQDSLKFTGRFLVADDNCYAAKADTLSIDFVVYDIDNQEGQFNAPNVITPNSDDHNDYFDLESIFNTDGTGRSMPLDNCAGQFMTIEIYNRWGAMVYASDQRDFLWQPLDGSAGVYYYYLKYTDKAYKGYVHVIF